MHADVVLGRCAGNGCGRREYEPRRQGGRRDRERIAIGIYRGQRVAIRNVLVDARGRHARDDRRIVHVRNHDLERLRYRRRHAVRYGEHDIVRADVRLRGRARERCAGEREPRGSCRCREGQCAAGIRICSGRGVGVENTLSPGRRCDAREDRRIVRVRDDDLERLRHRGRGAVRNGDRNGVRADVRLRRCARECSAAEREPRGKRRRRERQGAPGIRIRSSRRVGVEDALSRRRQCGAREDRRIVHVCDHDLERLRHRRRGAVRNRDRDVVRADVRLSRRAGNRRAAEREPRRKRRRGECQRVAVGIGGGRSIGVERALVGSRWCGARECGCSVHVRDDDLEGLRDRRRNAVRNGDRDAVRADVCLRGRAGNRRAAEGEPSGQRRRCERERATRVWIGSRRRVAVRRAFRRRGRRRAREDRWIIRVRDDDLEGLRDRCRGAVRNGDRNGVRADVRLGRRARKCGAAEREPTGERGRRERERAAGIRIGRRRGVGVKDPLSRSRRRGAREDRWIVHVGDDDLEGLRDRGRDAVRHSDRNAVIADVRLRRSAGQRRAAEGEPRGTRRRREGERAARIWIGSGRGVAVGRVFGRRRHRRARKDRRIVDRGDGDREALRSGIHAVAGHQSDGIWADVCDARRAGQRRRAVAVVRER